MSIYVTGDTHGSKSFGLHSVDGFLHRLNTNSFPEQKQMQEGYHYVVICGDFGGVWATNREAAKESKEEEYALDWLDDKPFTTLFVPGNHENYDRLTGIRDERLMSSWLYEKMPDREKQKLRDGYPRMPWNGGHVRMLRNHVLMLEPGVFTINERKCFVYGGARSHDIQGGILDPADFVSEEEFQRAYEKKYNEGLMFRVKGISWWEQEEPGYETEEAAWKALENAGWKVDFVFTHDCAASDLAFFGYDDRTRVNDFLQKIRQKLEYRHWFFGHLHGNLTLPGGRDHLLYEQIVQIQ